MQILGFLTLAEDLCVDAWEVVSLTSLPSLPDNPFLAQLGLTSIELK